ncbi:MoaD/ThiS family protein [Croceibacterium aestuarii]|uniref:MoaD/ThiS family protein n=1 Tax=Croceibacterium aestuarii TaxID=3064139 RepID=UPI00272E86D1|nr:MoaD/ThiS family protein [Croceibacterium sp. D39]
MGVKLVFLGKLADLAGAPEMEVDAPLDWGSLVEGLDADLAEAIEGDKVRLALNGTVLADKHTLDAGDGDEVALLPPVSGG